MSIPPKLESSARDALVGLLSQIPALAGDVYPNQWVQRSVEEGTDLTVVIGGENRRRCLLARIRPEMQPRQVREAAFWLKRAASRSEFPAYGLVIAPFVSDLTAAACREEGIGFLDLSGNCHLEFEGIHVHIEGKPNQFKSDRTLRTLYSPKAERVLRRMLAKPQKRWRITDLAQACGLEEEEVSDFSIDEGGVSVGLVSNVKRLLEDREWLATDETGFHISAPHEVLAEWKSQYRKDRANTRQFYSMKIADGLEVHEELQRQGLHRHYALTSLASAGFAAPTVLSGTIEFYLNGDVGRFAANAGLKPVETGGNVRVMEPYDIGVFFGMRQTDPPCVVHPIQIYLDLQGESGRAEEAAEFLYERSIRPVFDSI